MNLSYHTDRHITKDFRDQNKDNPLVIVRESQRLEAARAVVDEAYEILSDPKKKAAYDKMRGLQGLQELAYYHTYADAISRYHWTQARQSEDGSMRVEGAMSLTLLNKMRADEIVKQTMQILAEDDVVIIGGNNGNGKSQLLIQLANILELARTTGYVPAEFAALPKFNFVFSAVNAGETSEQKSSFQNEIDRYNDLLRRYIKAGSPEGGIIFLDEPLAGTSSEDQIAILTTLIAFFKERNCKVVLTNHNYRTYQALRNCSTSTGERIRFKPVAFLLDETDPYTLQEYDADDTDSIRSDGIGAAQQFDIHNGVLKLALWARYKMTGTVHASSAQPAAA